MNNELLNYSPPKYLALGDSLAVGIGAFWGNSYTRLYYNWLINKVRSAHLDYSNLGVIMWTSKDLLNAVTNNNNFRREIINSTIITIDIGGNDILRHRYSPDNLYQALENYKHNLYTTLYEIRCLNKHAQIYLMDIYNPYPLGHETHEISESWVTHFNSIIWSTMSIEEFKIAGIASVYSAFKGKEYDYTLIKYNNIHPNTLGYRIISECFKSVTTL